MITYLGPWCLVCDGENVVKRTVYGTVAWTDKGPRKGWYQRDVCLDCEENLKQKLEDIFGR